METMFVNRKGLKVWINKSEFNKDIEKEWTDKDEKALQEKTPKESMIIILRNGTETEIREKDYNEETDTHIDQGDPLLDMLDGNVGEIADKIAKIETIVELDKLFEAESNGKTRKGVTDAIKDRIEEIKG
jgi:hypothetical protein